MRRRRISQFQPVKRRSGVMARVAHSRYRAQSPVPWVTNSTGSTGTCRTISQTIRANGSNASTNSTLLMTASCLGDGLADGRAGAFGVIGPRSEVLLQVHPTIQG